MKTLRDLKVGDVVRVTDVNRRGAESLTVTKIGTKLLHVGEGWSRESFHLDDGRANDRMGHRRALTEEQFAYRKSVASAEQRLRDFGLMRSFSSISDDMVILADAVLAKEIAKYSEGGDRGLREEG